MWHLGVRHPRKPCCYLHNTVPPLARAGARREDGAIVKGHFSICYDDAMLYRPASQLQLNNGRLVTHANRFHGRSR